MKNDSFIRALVEKSKKTFENRRMKRHGNLYNKICSITTLYLADKNARKGKLFQPGVIEHIKNEDINILALHEILVKKEYKTSSYTTFLIWEPKERLIYRLPYYPDRIVHHACMLILEPIFVPMFTADTYSCIKGRGVHLALRKIGRALKDEKGTKYCLKIDITKFYPHVNHDILKGILRRKIKDPDLLALLDEIILSAEGLPIGNLLSQYFANLYMNGFDHCIKEKLKVKNYFRYCDDMIVLHDDKQYLHCLLSQIREYLSSNLKLSLKKNYQIFPVSARGIDTLGYVIYHTHTLLRKTIKKRFARLVAKRPNMASIASYYGWACHANCNHLLKKLLSNEKFQRLRDKAYNKGADWGKDQDRQDIKQISDSSVFQDRTI